MDYSYSSGPVGDAVLCVPKPAITLILRDAVLCVPKPAITLILRDAEDCVPYKTW